MQKQNKMKQQQQKENKLPKLYYTQYKLRIIYVPTSLPVLTCLELPVTLWPRSHFYSHFTEAEISLSFRDVSNLAKPHNKVG